MADNQPNPDRPKKVVPLKKAQVVKAAQLAKAESAKVVIGGKNQAAGFVNFVREQGVVGLAVGLAIGTAAGASVKQIVDGFINPIVGFLIGGIDLASLSWILVQAKDDGTGGLVIKWGAIVSSLITLVATALVIYLLIHLAKLDRVDRKKDA